MNEDAGRIESEPSAGPTLRGFLVLAVLALYLSACFLPAIHDKGAGEWFRARDFSGYEALLFGWMAPLPWSANVFLVAGCIA